MQEETKTKKPQKSKDPKLEHKELQRQSQEYLDGWKRAKADYANLKRESQERQNEIADYARALMLGEFVGIYDNFKLAFSHIKEEDKNQEWVVGIGYIKKQFADFLIDSGVKEIKTVGEMFDPLLHESVQKEEAEGKKSGEIIRELKGGYLFKGKTLIPAKVVIAE